MDVRLTIKTTAGRPILAAAVMAALLGATVLLVWAVSSYKLNRPIPLGPSVELTVLGMELSPPAGWHRRDWRDHDESVMMFVDASGQSASGRILLVRQLELGDRPPLSASNLMVAFVGVVRAGEQAPGPAPIGPLAGRQWAATTRGGRQLRDELLRAVVVGPGRYLLLELACPTAPSERDRRLMDRVAEAVRLRPDAYASADQVADKSRLDLTDQAAAWVVAAGAGRPAADLTLLPKSREQGGAGFWGLVYCHLDRVEGPGPAAGLLAWRPEDRRSQRSQAARAARRRGVSALQAAIETALLAARQPGLPVTPEERRIDSLTAWRTRRAEGDVVYLDYVLPAVALDEGDGQAAPATPDRQVVRVWGWVAGDEEAAGVEAIERLIGAIRVR